MLKSLEISSDYIGLEDIYQCLEETCRITLGDNTKRRIQENRTYLEQAMKASGRIIYGVNTGFGSLCNVTISEDRIEELQHRLIMSHACGQGETVTPEISRLMLLLKIKNLSFARSGVRLELIETMAKLYNNDITPVIYKLGSLGASGDLAPLAHMSLTLIGKGQVWKDGGAMGALPVLQEAGIKPLSLTAKEGLALINGTQFSLAYAIWASYHASRLMRWSNLIAAASLEAFHCSLDPFDEDLNKARNQAGQIEVAQEIRSICSGSEILAQKYDTVQDPYSFRCVPQVHGASKDCINYVAGIVERELNAVTDNPNVLDEEDKILSGGNFHAQPLALALDFLSIGLSELGSISERRTFKLVNGERGLPDYLTPSPGINSGFMIPQYTAASIVSQNKQLCTPASVDSISSSKGQEDHVSMAANAATKCYRVVNNLYSILAIELMVAMQALEFRKEFASSKKIASIKKALRNEVAPLDDDRVVYTDINVCKEFIKTRNF